MKGFSMMIRMKASRRACTSDIWFMAIVYASVSLLTLFIVFPFLIIFFQSITPVTSMRDSYYRLIPDEFDFSAYQYLLISSRLVINGLRNSAFLVVFGTLFSLTLTTMASYTLSKKYLPYRRFLTYIVYVPMMIGGGLIPTFLVVRFTGLYGSLWACIIPGAVSTWNIFLMRNFFSELPEELEEAALLDGANDLQILLKIILPISLPVLATMALFYGVGQWNSWFTPSIYLKNSDQWPLQMVVRQMINTLNMSYTDNLADLESTLQRVPSESIKKAAVFVTMVPVLVFYPFAQKYFVKGLVMGSVKG